MKSRSYCIMCYRRPRRFSRRSVVGSSIDIRRRRRPIFRGFYPPPGTPPRAPPRGGPPGGPPAPPPPGGGGGGGPRGGGGEGCLFEPVRLRTRLAGPAGSAALDNLDPVNFGRWVNNRPKAEIGPACFNLADGECGGGGGHSQFRTFN